MSKRLSSNREMPDSDEADECVDKDTELKQAEKRTHQAYVSAMRLLAHRDHSVAELTEKLRRREYDDNAIDSALQELIAANYVNDRRYAELFADQRTEKGFGPLAIRAKLRDRGIDSHHVQHAMSVLSADWSEKAAILIHRRFNAEEILGGEQRDIARIARYLQGRGFSSSDTARGLKAARQMINSDKQIDP